MRQKQAKARKLHSHSLAGRLRRATARIAELEQQLRYATAGCHMKEQRLRAQDLALRLMAAR